MIFNYKGVNKLGEGKRGTVEAVNIDAAIDTLQAQGLTLSSIVPIEERVSIDYLSFLRQVSTKDVVILSRQMATLFQSKVPALRVFKLLAAETENALLREALDEIANDLQAGSSISKALSRHPKIFSEFYVNMVKAGEESGRLDEIFLYLADYLDRTFEITSKAKGAFVYPLFVVGVFVGVVSLMLTLIIPKITSILIEANTELPIYTKIVIGTSDFLINYGLLFVIGIGLALVVLGRYVRTPDGALSFDSFKLSVPLVGGLYKKLYLSRIADNLNTMIISGIPILRAIEITSSVVGSPVYKQILDESLIAVKGGNTLSESLSGHPEMPGIMIQMMKVGEETGELGSILKTLSRFYQREVTTTVDTLVELIEPIMIVVLATGVGVLLAAVLLPIYDVAAGF
ncbi:MAG: type II secretion system F family protein [Candidatus Pacebacteria bacterium]|nr:type II secretion system F family protein [Candidatus Paceibacterota bacterium]